MIQEKPHQFKFQQFSNESGSVQKERAICTCGFSTGMLSNVNVMYERAMTHLDEPHIMRRY